MKLWLVRSWRYWRENDYQIMLMKKVETQCLKQRLCIHHCSLIQMLTQKRQFKRQEVLSLLDKKTSHWMTFQLQSWCLKKLISLKKKFSEKNLISAEQSLTWERIKFWESDKLIWLTINLFNLSYCFIFEQHARKKWNSKK